MSREDTADRKMIQAATRNINSDRAGRTDAASTVVSKCAASTSMTVSWVCCSADTNCILFDAKPRDIFRTHASQAFSPHSWRACTKRF